MRNSIIVLLFLVGNVLIAVAQNQQKCASVQVAERLATENPDLVNARIQYEKDIQTWIANNQENRVAQEAVKTIPVVVHVVYKNATENISDAVIKTQIDVLNKDFRKLNTDMVPSSHPFFSIAGDAGIEFCLATKDPSGNATTGIIRTSTSVSSFTDDDKVKSSSTGGQNPWNATKYLNLWVCNLESGLLGYASFPPDLASFPNLDGVVIGYQYFGLSGTIGGANNLGRTATHEIGHWLNLFHIWGDENNCAADDEVSDTPKQTKQNYACPAINNGFVTDACTTTNPGIMYQNYMDYTDDACMCIFTNGQIDRMKAVINTTRSGLFTDVRCTGVTAVNNSIAEKIRIYPNPINNYITIEGLPQTRQPYFNVTFINMLGKTVYTTQFLYKDALMELNNLNTGTYIMTIANDDFYTTQKITVVK
ncbi:MAG: M43 family zinc metalloprotease [Chitinophagales bacterium]